MYIQNETHEIRKTDKNEKKMMEENGKREDGTERTHTYTYKIFKQQNDLRFHC